jgi:hypothetical protein
MNNPHHRNMWCANAWVGAPWACGQPRYDEPVENFSGDSNKNKNSIDYYADPVYEGWSRTKCSGPAMTGCNKFNAFNDSDHKKCKKHYYQPGDIGLSCKDMKKSGYYCDRCYWDGTRCTSKPNDFKSIGTTDGKGVCSY